MKETVILPSNAERKPAVWQCHEPHALEAATGPMKSNSEGGHDHGIAVNRHRFLRPSYRAGTFGDPL